MWISPNTILTILWNSPKSCRKKSVYKAHKPEAEVAPVCDDEDSGEEYGEKRQRGAGNVNNRPVEPVARDKEVHANRRRAVSYLHVRQKDNPQMNRINAEVRRNRQDQRDNDHG